MVTVANLGLLAPESMLITTEQTTCWEDEVQGDDEAALGKCINDEMQENQGRLQSASLALNEAA